MLDAGYATGRDSKDGRQFDRNRTSVILGVTGTLELVIPLGARLGHPIWRKALAEAGVDPAVAEEVVERISAGYVRNSAGRSPACPPQPAVSVAVWDSPGCPHM